MTYAREHLWIHENGHDIETGTYQCEKCGDVCFICKRDLIYNSFHFCGECECCTYHCSCSYEDDDIPDLEELQSWDVA
jgi:multimeric flavodoxin WrbA